MKLCRRTLCVMADLSQYVSEWSWNLPTSEATLATVQLRKVLAPTPYVRRDPRNTPMPRVDLLVQSPFTLSRGTIPCSSTRIRECKSICLSRSEHRSDSRGYGEGHYCEAVSAGSTPVGGTNAVEYDRL